MNNNVLHYVAKFNFTCVLPGYYDYIYVTRIAIFKVGNARHKKYNTWRRHDSKRYNYVIN